VWIIRLEKMIEELGAENTEGDDDENFRVAPLYPSVYANIQTPNKGSRITLRYTCSLWL
jgi:hypothetical protein